MEQVAAAQQAAQASLIKVHKHAQAALPASRQNPFLQDAEVPDEPPLRLSTSKGARCLGMQSCLSSISVERSRCSRTLRIGIP